jgi:hypothetical protein
MVVIWMVLTVTPGRREFALEGPRGLSLIGGYFDLETLASRQLEEFSFRWRELVALVDVMHPPVRFVELIERSYGVVSVVWVLAVIDTIEAIHSRMPWDEMCRGQSGEEGNSPDSGLGTHDRRLSGFELQEKRVSIFLNTRIVDAGIQLV